jgi:DNA-binding NtrC family response regulator
MNQEATWRDPSRLVRVLVAVSHPAQRDSIARTLADAGLHVEAVGNGWEALRVFRELRPHLVVLDLHLSEVSGVALLGALGDAPVAPGFQALILSDTATLPALTAAEGRYVGDVLQKPVAPQALLSVVQTALERHRYEHKHPEEVQPYDEPPGAASHARRVRPKPPRIPEWR